MLWQSIARPLVCPHQTPRVACSSFQCTKRLLKCSVERASVLAGTPAPATGVALEAAPLVLVIAMPSTAILRVAAFKSQV